MGKDTLLVVEDEENLLEALKYNLEHEGYQILTATDGEQGLHLARERKPDMVILDLMLPKLDGLEVCRLLRREMEIPILMLTAKAQEVDRIVGLELGADDYVAKPFSMRELLARVKAVLRRSNHTFASRAVAEQSLLRAEDLEFDLIKHEVILKGSPLQLKLREFDLLRVLMMNKGKALTRDYIMETVWGEGFVGEIRTVDVHIRWLRQKIENDPSDPKRIVTIHGVGYRFEA